ncbi:MAG: hypothetical protein M5R36_23665 [Deltaproteobacteria bacterium]|nr:hypothetical protein [Deltaproteobacteria bacterium]
MPRWTILAAILIVFSAWFLECADSDEDETGDDDDDDAEPVDVEGGLAFAGFWNGVEGVHLFDVEHLAAETLFEADNLARVTIAPGENAFLLVFTDGTVAFRTRTGSAAALDVPLTARLTPNGRRVILPREGALFEAPVEGQGEHGLPDGAFQAAYSPDMNLLAYVAADGLHLAFSDEDEETILSLDLQGGVVLPSDGTDISMDPVFLP